MKKNVCFVRGGCVMCATCLTECPFYLVTLPRRRFQQSYREPRPGRIERVAISGIQADGFRYTPFVVGCPGSPVRDVSIRDVHLRKTAEFRSGPFAQPVPDCAQQYPTPFMFGSLDGGRRDCGDGLPAHGLYLRDVRDVGVNGYTVVCAKAEGRPLLHQESCKGVVLSDMTGRIEV